MPVRPDVPMRGLLIALVVVLAFGTTACGQGDQRSVAQEASSAAGSDSSFPVTVKHKFGTATIPAKPQRVVSVGYKEQDWLYEFGVNPVAVRQWYGVYPHEINPWAAPLVEGKPPVVLGTELNLERIAALRPDLILGITSGMTSKEYGQLSQIAPTVAGPVGTKNYNEPWRKITRMTGAALGQPKRSEEIIADMERLFARARKAHPELVGAEAAVASAWSADSTGVYSAGSLQAQMLAELGMKTPPEYSNVAKNGFWGAVSEELVGRTFDQADDAVVVLGMPLGKAQPGAEKVLNANPTFRKSRVNQEGRVVTLDTKASEIAYSFASPLSTRYTLRHLVPQLAAAVDGDPSTKVPESPASVK